MRPPNESSSKFEQHGAILMKRLSLAESFFIELQKLNTDEQRLAYIFENKPAEHEWLDYKQCPMKSATDFDQDDLKKKWAEYLSAFANTEGGLFIWGIQGTGNDTPGKVVPVQSLDGLQAILTKQIHQANDPPVQGVQYLQIETDGKDKGVLVCFVPLSPYRPHRKEYPALEKCYYYRAGESCKVIPHTMLQQMFYPYAKVDLELTQTTIVEKKPSPNNDRWQFTILLQLKNKGTVTAEEVCISLFSNTRITEFTGRSSDREDYFSTDTGCLVDFGGADTRIYLPKPMHPGMPFLPGRIWTDKMALAHYTPINGERRTRPKFERTLNYIFTLYAKNASPKVYSFTYVMETLNDHLRLESSNITIEPCIVITDDMES